MKNNFFKIIPSFISVALLLSVVFSILPSSPVSAADAFAGSCNSFLGLTSWDCGVNISDETSLKSGIWQIVANVATDITIIAAYLVLGYVIYGGYRYMFSGGDPGKVAAGKKILTHAFIGLAIVLLANAIMSTVRFVLLGAGGHLDGTADETVLVSSTIQWFIAIAGIVSAIFVVYGGVSYMTSAGDPGKVQKAKQTILYALIGLVIVALAQAITAFVTSTINNAASINQATIAKEVHETK